MSIWFEDDGGDTRLKSSAQDDLGRVISLREFHPPDPNKPVKLRFVWHDLNFHFQVMGVTYCGKSPEEIWARIPAELHGKLKKAGMQPKAKLSVIREEWHEVAPNKAEQKCSELGASCFFHDTSGV